MSAELTKMSKSDEKLKQDKTDFELFFTRFKNHNDELGGLAYRLYQLSQKVKYEDPKKSSGGESECASEDDHYNTFLQLLDNYQSMSDTISGFITKLESVI